MEDEEERIRDEQSGLGEPVITKGGSFLFENIDSFVALSLNDASIEHLEMYPFDSDPGNY
jgi:hypothetical protein